jgi:cysteine desulfurase
MNVRPERQLHPAAGIKPIYLDHHATTPVDQRVADLMVKVMTTQFGNPNDRGHVFGDEAAELISAARLEIARLVGGDSDGVLIQRSATVAAEAVIASLADNRGPDQPLRVAATTVEHRALLDALAKPRNTGAIAVRWIDVDGKARIALDHVEEALSEGCDLLCVMAANNEVGTVYPVEQIARLARDHDVPFLVDATQAAGHIPIDVEGWGISYLLLAAHKMYGPKGIAALVVGSDASSGRLRTIEKMEGTPNVPAIAGFGEACRLRRLEMAGDVVRVSGLRDRLEAILTANVNGLVVNGHRENRMGHNLHFAVPGVPNEAVVSRLSQSVALSTGAACRSGVDETSHVLQAMRLSEEIIDGSLRIGLGRTTSERDVVVAAELIATAIEDTRRAMNNGAER